MKYILLGFTLISFFSCTRTNDVVNTPPVDSVKVLLPVLDTFIVYKLGPKEINLGIFKWEYDNQGKLINVYGVASDTTFGGSIYPDTFNIKLDYHGADSLPYLCTVWDFQNSKTSSGYEYHYLSYDDKQRLIIDSMKDSHTDRYIYSDGFFTISNPYGTYTFYMDGDNLTHYVFPYESYGFTYGNYMNPLYFPKLNGLLGRYFTGDFMSGKLFNQRKIISTLSDFTANYEWTTDSEGRVVSGVGTDQGTGKPLEYYWFIYKK